LEEQRETRIITEQKKERKTYWIYRKKKKGSVFIVGFQAGATYAIVSVVEIASLKEYHFMVTPLVYLCSKSNTIGLESRNYHIHFAA